MKVTQRLCKFTSQYIRKNTVQAKYDRAMDVAAVSGLLTGVQVFRFPTWNVTDVGLTSIFGTTFFGSVGKAIKHRIALQPIRNRAIQIKKAARLAEKLNRKV